MSIESYLNFSPTIPDCVFLASSADVIGRVTIGQQSSVWYNTTLRGDINEIKIGNSSNVQDNAVLHNADDYPCIIGDLVTIGHSAIIHACSIDDEVLVGMGATILDGVKIGKQSIIGANSLVTKGSIIPEGSLVLGSPATIVRALTDKERSDIKLWAQKYVRLSRTYISRDSETPTNQI